MSPMLSALRTGAGFLLAVIVAPAGVAACLIVADWPKRGVNLPNDLAFTGIAVLFGFPFTLLFAVIFGIPLLVFARLAGIQSVRYYALCGIVFGLLVFLMDHARTHSETWGSDMIVCVIGGLAATSTYWLIAERPRLKGPRPAS